MLLSRGATIFKNASRLGQRNHVEINVNQIRNKWYYRSLPPQDKTWLVITECMGGVMWWWILWNLYHEHDHITGHFPYPRPIEWTDEELGIPPD